MKFPRKTLTCFALALLSLGSASASTIVVNFGAAATTLSGTANAVTSLSSTPSSLKDNAGHATDLSIAYTGNATVNTTAAGTTTALDYGTASSDAWTAAGGTDFSTVVGSGLGFNGGNGDFTFSGLTVGQEYTLTMLFGRSGTGGYSRVGFYNIDTDYTFTTYANATADAVLVKESGEDDYLINKTILASGKGGAVGLTFTATETNFLIRHYNAAYGNAVQGMILNTIPEPSSAVLFLTALGGLALRRRRN